MTVHVCGNHETEQSPQAWRQIETQTSRLSAPLLQEMVFTYSSTPTPPLGWRIHAVSVLIGHTYMCESLVLWKTHERVPCAKNKQMQQHQGMYVYPFISYEITLSNQ